MIAHHPNPFLVLALTALAMLLVYGLACGLAAALQGLMDLCFGPADAEDDGRMDHDFSQR
jgi:hypothetical protein